jgi:hypothetical protein
MKQPKLARHHVLFWLAVGLTCVGSVSLPLLALAWRSFRILQDDFGTTLSPPVQWFWDHHFNTFAFIGIPCIAAGTTLYLSAGYRQAIYFAIVIAALVILAEVMITTCCIIFPIAALARDLS